ncbi:aspartate/glutamate racemase family protein [Alcaligenaceae bacterium]|nr:aspartate/glutamate racemase family protein [Alcaligenaceae bacterium]
MNQTIYVINPNSNQYVTDGISEAMEPLRSADGPAIECVTLQEGPRGIQCQRDVDSVITPMVHRAQQLEESAGAFVIACFSDPGLYSLREVTTKPVLGIAESGVLTALTQGQRFGVIAILPGSIPRHLRYFGAMGVLDRFAGDLAINMAVADLADKKLTFERMCEVGSTLIRQHGADVLVMGCAGMASFRAGLQQELKTPVIEPTQAAVSMAIGRVRLG